MERAPFFLTRLFRNPKVVIAVTVIAVFLGALGALVIKLQTMLAFPYIPTSAQIPAAVQAFGGEVIRLDVDGKRVEAWFMPARNPGRAPLIINAHGNGELIDQWAERVGPVRDAGFGVLLVEYPGYGRSEGMPSERSISDAMVAAYDWAAKDPRVDPRRIVAHGRSMGGGAVGQLAKHRQLAALILESSFASLADMVRAHGVPDFLVTNRFDTYSVLREYRGPVLIIHGVDDEVIPFLHARRLASVAPQARFVELPCHHNDCPPQWELVLGFLAENGVSGNLPTGDAP
jgi:fermentation-respiration switch protein FrsA (DUF1100 family)